jgi:hypothetical protein
MSTRIFKNLSQISFFSTHTPFSSLRSGQAFQILYCVQDKRFGEGKKWKNRELPRYMASASSVFTKNLFY